MILHGVSEYYQLFGLSGVARATLNRTFGFPEQISCTSRRLRYPVYLRLRTSDVSLFREFMLHDLPYNLQLPRVPRVIVDAGANIGMASLRFANSYPQARIIAVEPEPSNFTMLVKNAAPYPNIIPVQAALWNRDCTLHLGPTGLDSPEYGKWAFAVSDHGIPVRGLTMQTLMRENGLAFIDLLKMDIEGGELEAFANCAEWMKATQAVIIELHDHMRPGCKAIVDAACQGFQVSTDGGEMTFYIR